MFGQILKEIRKKNNLTQKDMAALLANCSEEFGQLDLVTISRWERGVTSPNDVKAVRILRCLKEDLRPFLYFLSSHQSESADALDDFIYKRFYSKLLEATMAAFDLDTPENKKRIKHDKAFASVNDPIIYKIRDYHRKFNHERLDLMNLDLYLYQEEKKLLGYRYYYDDDPDKSIIGHSIFLFFEIEEIEEQIRSKGYYIDLKKSTKYKKDKSLSMFLTSAIITSEAVFKYHWKKNLEFLATHTNITHLYANIMIEPLEEFTSKLGFEVVATKNLVERGGIKIGKRRYERCLVKIDTAVLLTSKEALAILWEVS